MFILLPSGLALLHGLNVGGSHCNSGVVILALLVCHLLMKWKCISQDQSKRTISMVGVCLSTSSSGHRVTLHIWVIAYCNLCMRSYTQPSQRD